MRYWIAIVDNVWIKQRPRSMFQFETCYFGRNRRMPIS